MKKNRPRQSLAGYFLLSLLSFFIVFCNGCAFLAVTFESVRKAGLTTESRKELLPPFLSRFSDSLSWIDSTRALAFASDSYRQGLKERLLKSKDKVKVIGTEILLTEYNDDATRAEVTVRSKFYRIPVYIAEEKMEKQIWVYDGGGVWQLDNIEAVE